MKKEEQQEDKFSLAEVPTQTEPRIYDGKKAYTIQEAMVLILNKLEKIEKNIVG